MKIYFHMNIESFSNCYVVVNEDTKQALIIDPGKITKEIINQIETDGYDLAACLITHNHPGHLHGLATLRRIYTPTIIAADTAVAGNETSVIKGEGVLNVAGLRVEYFALPGHSADSMVYKIENVIFTGDSLTAGEIGTTNSDYAKMTLTTGILTKVLTLHDDTVIMPGHGPMTSIGSERRYNIDLQNIVKELSVEQDGLTPNRRKKLAADEPDPTGGQIPAI